MYETDGVLQTPAEGYISKIYCIKLYMPVHYTVSAALVICFVFTVDVHVQEKVNVPSAEKI